MEHYVQKDGRAVTQHLSTYLIPGVLDVAEVVEPIILENPDPQGPFGRARHGRDALHPDCAGHRRRHPRRYRRLDRRTALHTGAGLAGAPLVCSPARTHAPRGHAPRGAPRRVGTWSVKAVLHRRLAQRASLQLE